MTLSQTRGQALPLHPGGPALEMHLPASFQMADSC